MMDAEKGTMDEDTLTKIEKFLNRRPVMWTIFGALVALSVFSIYTDWSLFVDILRTRDGLVLGSPGIDILTGLGLCNSLGVIMFIFEVVNALREMWCSVIWLNEDTVQVMTMFLVEIPSTTVNLLIALCREIAISYFQLVKAGVSIFGIFVRTILTISHYFWYKKTEKHRQLSRLLILIGLLYTLATSLAVFLFTYTTPDQGKSLEFRKPSSWVSESIRTGQYFQNVSIYLNRPEFSKCLGPSSGERVSNWLRLASLMELVEAEGDIQIQYKWINDSSVFAISGKYRVKDSDIDYTDCYLVPGSGCILESVNCPPALSNHSIVNTVYMKFHFVEPHVTQVLGDVLYNWRIERGSECRPAVKDQLGFLQYFRVNLGYNDSLPIVRKPDGALTFYQTQKSIKPVAEIWKTGYHQCEMTGSPGPNFDKTLPVSCSIRTTDRAQHKTNL